MAGADQVHGSGAGGGIPYSADPFVYGKNKVVYTADDIDVLAAHVVPLDVWWRGAGGGAGGGDEFAALSG